MEIKNYISIYAKKQYTDLQFNEVPILSTFGILSKDCLDIGFVSKKHRMMFYLGMVCGRNINFNKLRQLCEYIDNFKDLLKCGVDLNIRDTEGCTILIYYSNEGRIDLVGRLIGLGCDLDVVSNRGNTALIMACYRKHVEVVRLLVSAGCALNISNNLMHTPLMAVSCIGDRVRDQHNKIKSRGEYRGDEVVVMLVDAESRLDMLTNDGESIFDHAIRINNRYIERDYYKNKEITKILVSAKCALDKLDRAGNTALMLASSVCNTEIVQILVSAGCDLNIANNDGETALMKAVKHGKVVEILIGAKCMLDIADNWGRTALMHACFINILPGTVRRLIGAKCSLDIVDNEGITAITHAVQTASL